MVSHYRLGEGDALTLSWQHGNKWCKMSFSWVEIFLEGLQVEHCNVESKKKKKKHVCFCYNTLQHMKRFSRWQRWAALNFTIQHFIEEFWSQFGCKSPTDPSADVKHQSFLLKTLLQMSRGTVWLKKYWSFLMQTGRQRAINSLQNLRKNNSLCDVFKMPWWLFNDG